MNAQTVQGVVTGTVFDPTGAVLPNASITLTNVATNVEQSGATGSDGSYRFNLVPPGIYKLSVKAPGFTEKQITDIRVEPSQTTPVNVTLSVASATTTVEVEAQDVLVQTATAELATTVNQAFITNIPLLSRNIFDLAFLAPSVTQGMDLRPASGGARQSGTAYLLNGADNNDNFSEGVPNLQPALESVEEFSLLTNSMSAQYGRAGGVIVSAVQRSGANDFHGVLYEFNRNRSLNSSDFFQNRQGSPKPKYIRNQFGGVVSGPVVHNKAFFAFGYDRIDTRTGSEIDEQVPTPTELTRLNATAGPLAKQVLSAFPLKTSTILCPDQAANAPDSIGHIGCVHVFNPVNTGRNTYYGKLDHNFSSNDRIAGTLNFSRQLNNNLFGGGHASAQPINELDHDNYHNISLVHTHMFGPRLINEATVAHNRHLSDSLQSINGDTKIKFPAMDIDGADYGLGFSIGPFEGFNSSFTQDRWQVQDNLSWMRGSHTFKFGGSYQYGIVYRNWDLGNPGYYEFGNVFGSPVKKNPDGTIQDIDQTDSSFSADVPYFSENAIDPRTGAAANAYRHYIMKDATFFVQDDWKVSPRLTLNLGLRWERYGAPTEANNIVAQFTNFNCLSIDCVKNARVGPVSSMWKTNNHDFGPRFGFAYDIFGNHRTAIRGGFGIFYDRIFDNVWSNGAWNPPFYGLLDLDATSSDRVLYTLPASNSPSGFTPNPQGNLPFRVSVRTMDVHMRDTSVMNYNLTVEHQFLSDMLFRLTYQGNQGRHLPVLMNFNRFDGMRYNPTFADARPNPAYTGFNYRANNVNSNYNSMITELQKRLRRGLQFQFSYTWSKLMDYGSDLFSGETTQGSYSQPYYFVSNARVNTEKGAGAFDHTHAYKLAFIWEIPVLRDQKGFLGQAFGGWQLSSFYQAYSGHPLEIFNTRTRNRGNARDANGVPENLGGDYNLDGVANDRPDFVGNISTAYSGKSPADGIFSSNGRVGCGFPSAQSTNIAACNTSFGVGTPNSLFVNPPGTGARFGSLGRNVFRGPWFNGIDATLQKNFKLWSEQSKLNIRIDGLNLINHPNFDGLDTNLNSGNFGRAQILVGSAPARRIQLGARLSF